MPHEIHGRLVADGYRFALAVSRFNEFVTSKLVTGAVDTLVRHGAKDDQITCAYAPGAFELPLLARKLAASRKFDAVVCIGCVIRGQTPHFEFVAGEAAKGIAQVAASTGVPVTFGVVTTDTLEQAVDRAGGKVGNKGADAALSAIEMVSLLRQVPAEG